jgi:hypothetical protein
MVITIGQYSINAARIVWIKQAVSGVEVMLVGESKPLFIEHINPYGVTKAFAAAHALIVPAAPGHETVDCWDDGSIRRAPVVAWAMTSPVSEPTPISAESGFGRFSSVVLPNGQVLNTDSERIYPDVPAWANAEEAANAEFHREFIAPLVNKEPV